MDKRQILSALVIAGILSSISISAGAIWDFQNIKRKVEQHENQLSVIGTVVCEYAIRDNLPNSTDKCVKMLRGK